MLKPVNLTVGCDPEGFFSKDGVIVGSEKVIPESGLKAQAVNPHVVLDGVQFELNPPARSNVSLLGREVSIAMELVARQLKKFGGQVQLDWRGLVEVSREELDGLSDRTRILGCMPSKNFYEERPIAVDATTYRKRSAGGHAHFGLDSLPAIMSDRNGVLPYLDIFVGNLSVLVDRDPGAAERRENYGRAGEFRLPSYGLEYRTPSNFWLRSYSLMSLVFGMANLAFTVYHDELTGGSLRDELLDLVNIDKIILAINSNSWALARDNFERIRPFLAKHLPKSGFPLNPDNLGRFETFAAGVNDKGLAAFFPEDPLAHWVGRKQVEFPDFLTTIY